MTTVTLYDAAGRDRDIDLAGFDISVLGREQLLWVDGSPNDMAGLPHLPKPMREALGAGESHSGVEIFDAFYRFRVTALSQRAEAPVITFIVAETWLMTLSDPRPDFMDRFVETDRGETLKGRMTPSALAAALLSEHMAGYRTEIAGLDKAVDTLDDTIMRAREKHAPLRTLAVLRRRIASLRTSLDDLGATIHALTRPDFFAHIDEADRGHFESLSHTHDRLEDMVVRARETIFGSFDLYATRVAQDTNQLVKALTIVTVITGVIGAAAGVFGMNFDTPFSHSGVVGFYLVSAGMVFTAFIILGLAWWRRWL